MSDYLQGFGAFMQVCVYLGCVMAIMGVAYHIYIAHLGQKNLTRKNGEKQYPDQSSTNQWPQYVCFRPKADILIYRKCVYFPMTLITKINIAI